MSVQGSVSGFWVSGFEFGFLGFDLVDEHRLFLCCLIFLQPAVPENEVYAMLAVVSFARQHRPPLTCRKRPILSDFSLRSLDPDKTLRPPTGCEPLQNCVELTVLVQPST